MSMLAKTRVTRMLVLCLLMSIYASLRNQACSMPHPIYPSCCTSTVPLYNIGCPLSPA